jgi:single-strand selective monofunctional uracil DNA glycosylase
MDTPHLIYRDLIRELLPLRFKPPVACVYNPLEYAWQPFAQYLKLYAKPPKEILLLGMNPGPWGMAQTGVPFGEVSFARDWLKVQAPVGQPKHMHPKRPILGFDCKRSEVSGSRLWGWARERFHSPGRFFERFFIGNYCPLVFMESCGKNLTPDKLPKEERRLLEQACDNALRRLVEYLRPKHVIGVGGFARGRAEEALKGMPYRIGQVLHPSPANPQAHKDWAKKVEASLLDQGVEL